MFKKVIILLIAVICVSSGAFAIISNYGLENTNDSAKNSLVNDIKDISSSSESFLNNIKNDNIMDDFKDYWQYTFGYLVNVDGELRHYINDNGAYYLESEGLTDRYIVCVDCGGLIPIGPITNPLPKAAICHHNDISKLLDFSEVIKYSYSRDEAYNWWVYAGMPVFDDSHFKTYTAPDPTLYCKDCDGYVHLNLKNLTQLKWLFLHNHGFEIDNYFNRVDMPIATLSILNLCSHYNDDLDLFNTPIENFHSGWFKSIRHYNAFMYKVIHLLKDNSTSLENKTLNDLSLENWYHWYAPENFSYVEYKSLNKNNTSIDTNINETVTPTDKNVIDEVVYREDNETYIEDFNQDLDNEEPLDNYVDSVKVIVNDFDLWLDG